MGDGADEERQEHQRWVANYFRGKIDEFSYRLEEIVSACDTSLACAMADQNHPGGTGKAVTYGFSAFSNLVQTLKDSASSFLNSEITWRPIKALRHGQFFYMSRNAATHDGNPIISCWVDGYFYIPSDIRRLDNNGKLIVIPAPAADVRTVCLEFSADFAHLLTERLSGMERTSFLLGTSYDPDEVAAFMDSDRVPQFAKELFAQSAEQFEAVVSACKFDPVEDSVAKLATLGRWCEARLQP
ncbi:hypothetical protein IQ22_03831 [Pseudomonas duriflava]|uniref:Uncharacterized protein n=1 Tax=Pseudomonas duriflava TaxID=459528 RepID=A0A562Q169_9PSED|nr:hypothetical protein [Pseudomonas duriflava]TWI50441.1 hypothetical protein IQ22_03831 [Pseudomonas duriflava]